MNDCKSIISTIYGWINTWFWDIETKNEYTVSKEAIFLYLKKDIVLHAIGETGVNAIAVFITKHLSVMEHKWLRCHRLHVFGMDQKTTSIVESANATTKKGPIRVTASMKINKSAEVMVKISDNQLAKRAT